MGAGVQYIHFFNESSKLGPGTSFALDDGFGFTLQGGLDIAVGDGWYLNADVKKTWLGMDHRSGGTGITADVDLDPLVVSAGFGYRFNLSDLLGGHGGDTGPFTLYAVRLVARTGLADTAPARLEVAAEGLRRQHQGIWGAHGSRGA